MEEGGKLVVFAARFVSGCTKSKNGFYSAVKLNVVTNSCPVTITVQNPVSIPPKLSYSTK